MVTYKLTTPVTVGSLGSPITVKALQVTGINSCLTPPLAQAGTGILAITVTETTNGWQQTFNYRDTSVPALWNAAQSPAANTKLGDIVAQAIFAKLLADGKLPAGTTAVS